MAVLLDSFHSASGLHFVKLEEFYLHGKQAWRVTAEKPDGSKTDKVYLNYTEAKHDFDKLHTKLEVYDVPELDA